MREWFTLQEDMPKEGEVVKVMLRNGTIVEGARRGADFAWFDASDIAIDTEYGNTPDGQYSPTQVVAVFRKMPFAARLPDLPWHKQEDAKLRIIETPEQEYWVAYTPTIKAADGRVVCGLMFHSSNASKFTLQSVEQVDKTLEFIIKACNENEKLRDLLRRARDMVDRENGAEAQKFVEEITKVLS